MKKTLFLFTLIVASAFAHAQVVDIPAAPPKFILTMNKKVQAHLNVTDDQKKKIHDILDSIVQDDGQGRQMIRISGDTDMKQLDKDVMAILTEDQLKRFSELYVQRAGFTALSLKEYAEKLSITDNQKKELEGVWEERKADLEKLIDSSAGNGEVRVEKADMDKLKAEVNKKVEAILTKEQLEKWKGMQGEKFDFGDEG